MSERNHPEREAAPHEDAAWAWIQWSGILDDLSSKQDELEIADLVVAAFLLYEQMGPEGPIGEWRRPYIVVEDEYVFERDAKGRRTPWTLLLNEAMRLSREKKQKATSAG